MTFIDKLNKIITVILPVYLLIANASAIEKLYVFYPSTIEPVSMQNILTNNIKEVDVTVFSRYDAFIKKINQESPDVIITKTVILRDQFSDYKISLNGERNGTIEEKYVILTIDTLFKIDSLKAETVIAALDVVGKNGMKSLLTQLFPVEPKLKRVNKVGDLLSVLSFNMAEGVLIEDVFVNYFKTTSQLQFTVISVPGNKSGIVAVAGRKNESDGKILKLLKQNDKTVCDLFYIDNWKPAE